MALCKMPQKSELLWHVRGLKFKEVDHLLNNVNVSDTKKNPKQIYFPLFLSISNRC